MWNKSAFYNVKHNLQVQTDCTSQPLPKGVFDVVKIQVATELAFHKKSSFDNTASGLL